MTILARSSLFDPFTTSAVNNTWIEYGGIIRKMNVGLIYRKDTIVMHKSAELLLRNCDIAE